MVPRFFMKLMSAATKHGVPALPVLTQLLAMSGYLAVVQTVEGVTLTRYGYRSSEADGMVFFMGLMVVIFMLPAAYGVIAVACCISQYQKARVFEAELAQEKAMEEWNNLVKVCVESRSVVANFTENNLEEIKRIHALADMDEEDPVKAFTTHVQACYMQVQGMYLTAPAPMSPKDEKSDESTIDLS